MQEHGPLPHAYLFDQKWVLIQAPLNLDESNFFLVKIIDVITPIFKSKNIDKIKINRIIKLLKDNNCYDYKMVINTLLKNKLYNEAIIVCNSIPEKWGMENFCGLAPKWGMGNGKWGMGNGKSKMGNGNWLISKTESQTVRKCMHD